MPVAFPPTVAEREAELVALQSAFDEYIASSRELEEELDAELAKMQEKLAESTAANAALSAQLENIAPQLTSLETALTESRQKLQEEQRLRRAAEQAQDEADQRVREIEQTLQHVREECDVVHEELAFKENELEETRLELEVEKQQLQNELEAARQALEAAARDAARQTSLMDDSQEGAARGFQQQQQSTAEAASEGVSTDNATRGDDTGGGGPALESVPSVDDAYVRKLEEELELVTEQLIETEKRLSETESQMQEMQSQVQQLQMTGKREEDEEVIRTLQTENADRLDAEQKLRDELSVVREELTLAKEEIALQQEELQAAEEDSKQASLELEEERTKHKNVVHRLTIAQKEAEMASKNSLEQSAMVAQTVKEANDENERLREEMAALNQALKNAESDYKSVLEELDAVSARFDEATKEAEQAGRERAAEEVKLAMKTDVAHEVAQVKEQLNKLQQENAALQQKVDDAEMALATAQDKTGGDAGASAAGASGSVAADQNSEVVKKLQAQLQRSREDIQSKDQEMQNICQALEQRLAVAEKKVTKLESELSKARSQLAESEAHLIVLRRDKERADNTIPLSPKQRQRAMEAKALEGAPVAPDLTGSRSGGADGSAGGTGSGRSTPARSRSVEREELSYMDEEPDRGRLLKKGGRRNRSRSTSPSSVIKLEYQLQEENKKLTDLQKEFAALQDQKRMGEARIKRLESDLKILQKELFSGGGDTAVVTQMTRLSSLASKEGKNMDIIAVDEQKQEKHVSEVIASGDKALMADELKQLEKKCNSQREYNAQLLSKMLHLQGNIQVYCRVRPMTVTELQKGYKSVVEALGETEVGCFDGRTQKWKSFGFDRVWGPDQSQQAVFQDVEPLALSVVDGYNACIFAYGQTGSGKTYTMEGLQESNQYGISYRTIQKIFHLLNLRAQQQRAAEMFVGSDGQDGEVAEQVAFTFTMKLGMLEIYNDEIFDLLAAAGSSMAEKKEAASSAGGKASLEIRRNKDGRIEVPNLTKEPVNSIQEVLELLRRGNGNRATACTDMNEHSSRSHMVLVVDVMSGLDETQSNKGTLYLVDLAGSERVRKSHVEGDQLKEAGFINKSLSALGNVMEALDRKASHVPYRDSKLTYLLQDSLGGNSRTMMVVTICPVDSSYDESVHALQFATRVRRIQIGAAQRNVTSKNLEETVKTLTEEMRALTRAKERTESQLHSLKRDNARVQEKLSNISKQRSQNRSDSKTLEVLRKNNDDMAARWQKERSAREEAAEELEHARKELRLHQQQLGKFKSKMQLLEQKLEDKERQLELSERQLRQERNEKNALSVRARRQQVLNTRTTPRSPAVNSHASGPAPPTTNTVKTETSAGGSAPAAVNSSSPATAGTSAATVATATSGGVSAQQQQQQQNNTNEATVDDEVSQIRAQVLQLLEKHDKAKVNRVDILMEKFRGKEALLLEKMTQRYEGDHATAASAAAPAPGGPLTSAQKRNEMALERHRERMLKIREKQQQKQQPNK